MKFSLLLILSVFILGSSGSSMNSSFERISSGTVVILPENTNCINCRVVAGKIKGDDIDSGADQAYINLDYYYHPKHGWRQRTISYGRWANPQCGKSGYGWHISNVGTCGKGAGDGMKRIDRVWVVQY
jgi:hypothetical protein